MSSFENIAQHHGTAKYLPENEENIFHHSVDEISAKQLVAGYLKVLDFVGFALPDDNRCVDIGCGVGNITKEFRNSGMNIHGVEYDEIAVNAAHRYNPELPVVQGDITKFQEPEAYDFIFSREVYLFTRVNAFTDQFGVLSSLVDALRPGGVLMLSASRHSRPHCADFDLIMKTLAKDPRVGKTSAAYHEQLFTRFTPPPYKIAYWALKALMSLPIVYLMKTRNPWAPRYIYVIIKKARE
jgi:SAM-dependent methyltransferase